MTFKVAPPLILRTFMPEPHVRLAKAQDVNDILGLVKTYYEEEPPFPLPFDDKSVFKLLLTALQGNSVAGVISNEDELETSCYLSVATPWYSSEPVVESLWSYTHPDHRKSSNSKQILLWERQQAERLNCALQTSVAVTEDNKARLALMERTFGPKTGVSFYHTPNPAEPTPLDGPEVIPASLADLPEVIEVARELGKENSAYQVNEDIAIPMIRSVLAGDGLVGIVRAEDGRIAGTILLKIAYYWGSSQPFLDEYWVYVRGEYRKSNIARSLIQFAKHQADKLGLLLRIGIISKVELARKMQLYERLLGAPKVCHHTYVPN